MLDPSWCWTQVDPPYPVPFDAEKVNYARPSFFEKFFELQAVMWTTNAGLTDRHAYDSRPQHWPWLRRGIVSAICRLLPLSSSSSPSSPCSRADAPQNFWVQNHRQVYLVGNPVVWWSSTAAVVAYLAVRALFVIRDKRGFRDLYSRECGGAQLLGQQSQPTLAVGQ